MKLRVKSVTFAVHDGFVVTGRSKEEIEEALAGYYMAALPLEATVSSLSTMAAEDGAVSMDLEILNDAYKTSNFMLFSTSLGAILCEPEGYQRKAA